MKKAKQQKRTAIAAEPTSKKCSKCNIVHPIAAYGFCKGKRIARCRTCSSATRSARRALLRSQGLSAYSPSQSQSRRGWEARNKQAVQAKNVVATKKRKGELAPESCHRCSQREGECHHPDYSKPGECVWLCRRCHRLEHRSLAITGDNPTVTIRPTPRARPVDIVMAVPINSMRNGDAPWPTT